MESLPGNLLFYWNLFWNLLLDYITTTNVQEETDMVNKARKKIKEEMKDRDEMTESARIYDVRTSGGRLDFLKKVPEIMKICVEKLFLLRLF